MERQCERCSKAFTVTTSRALKDRGRFCSPECRITPVAERFWSKVNTFGPVPSHRMMLGPCWIWTRGKDARGYGTFDLDGKTVKAHKMAWALAIGAISDGLCVLHRCDNPSCVRTDHLFLGTIDDNNKDCDDKGRRPRPVGEAHPLSRLTNDAVREIRKQRSAGVLLRVLAAQYGVSLDTIHDVATGRTWRHVS